VGKTTLAKQLIQAGVLQHYFSFDDPVLLSAATSGPRRLSAGAATAVRAGRGAAGFASATSHQAAHRRAPRWAGDLLLTGSANPLRLPRPFETMVGRMATVTQMPLSQSEIEGRQPW
jgi:predicted AAA+ superfamily ATPase